MSAVVLDAEADRIWRQNRAMLVAASHPENVCRCGGRKEILKNMPYVLSVCVKRKWWNFWRHDPPKIVLQF